jgi:hypothetical protein
MFPEPSPPKLIYGRQFPLHGSGRFVVVARGKYREPRGLRGFSAAPEPLMWVDVYYWKVSAGRVIEYLFRLVNNIPSSEG